VSVCWCCLSNILRVHAIKVFDFATILLHRLNSLTICSIVFTEVLLGGCRLLNLDPEQAVVDGVDDVEI